MSKGTQITIGASLIVLLLGWYAWSNLGTGANFQYYQNLDEFLADAPSLEGRSLRVHGYVANDSIQRNLETRQVRFSVQNEAPHKGIAAGHKLDVLYLGLETPDLFKDGAEVVVEGRMVASSAGPVFEADKIMAKCPSKFEAEPMGSTES